MKKVILNVLVVAVLCAATVFIVEGIHAVVLGSRLDGSITSRAREIIAEAITGGRRGKQAGDQQGPAYTQLLEDEEIESLIPKLKADVVALGNSRFTELKNPGAAINTRQDGCLVQKPNVHKTLTYLRTNLGNPLDPMTMFYDSERHLDSDVEKLVDTYGIRRVAFTTNAQGERISLPAVTSDRKVIVAGDSVAVGAMVDDAETISSQLQALDPARQYINMGIGAAKATDVICALNRAAQRYRGQIDELIYVYCENDLKQSRPYGTPQQVIDWLKDFVKAQDIAKVTVVYAPYIYNIVPQFTRFRGYPGWRHQTRAKERAELSKLVRDAGFRYFDISDVALEEIDRTKTQFAALSVFSDHVHLSPYGIKRLVVKLRED